MPNSKWARVESVIASSKGQALFAFDQNAHMGALRRGMADDQEEASKAGDWRAIGNDEMYLEEVLNARVRLRYNGAVVQELRKWVRATESLNKRSGGQPYILFVDKVLYTTVMSKVVLAMTTKMTLPEITTTTEEDWTLDSRGEPAMGLERFKDCLFELADLWTSGPDPAEYAAFLSSLLVSIYTWPTFRADHVIKRGVARPPGFPEDEEDPARRQQKYMQDEDGKYVVKSKFMQDAEEQARQRHEAAQLLQKQAKAAQERQQAKEQAKAAVHAADASMRNALEAKLGRLPTNAELTAARDEAMMDRLRAELGREPTEAEQVAAREHEMIKRLTAKNGSPPSAAELAHARDVAIRERLEATLGRPPTEAEVAAATEQLVRVQLAMSLGREPTAEEMEEAREVLLQQQLLGKLGRPPNALELEEAREMAIRARLRALNGGREPTEDEMHAARDNALRVALKVKLGREPTPAELRMKQDASRKLRAKSAVLGREGEGGYGGEGENELHSVRLSDTQMGRVAAAMLKKQWQDLHMQQLKLLPSPRAGSHATLLAQAAVLAATLLGCQRPESRAPIYRRRRVHTPLAPVPAPPTRLPHILPAASRDERATAASDAPSTTPTASPRGTLPSGACPSLRPPETERTATQRLIEHARRQALELSPRTVHRDAPPLYCSRSRRGADAAGGGALSARGAMYVRYMDSALDKAARCKAGHPRATRARPTATESPPPGSMGN